MLVKGLLFPFQALGGLPGVGELLGGAGGFISLVGGVAAEIARATHVLSWVSDRWTEGLSPLTGVGAADGDYEWWWAYYGQGVTSPEEASTIIRDALKAIIWPTVSAFADTNTGSVIVDYLLTEKKLSITDVLATTDIHELANLVKASDLPENYSQANIAAIIADVLEHLATQMRSGFITPSQLALDALATAKVFLTKALAEGEHSAIVGKGVVFTQGDIDVFTGLLDTVTALLEDPALVIEYVEWLVSIVLDIGKNFLGSLFHDFISGGRDYLDGPADTLLNGIWSLVLRRSFSRYCTWEDIYRWWG